MKKRSLSSLASVLALSAILVASCQGCLYSLIAQGGLMAAGLVGMAVDRATEEENDTTMVDASWDEWAEEQRRLDQGLAKAEEAVPVNSTSRAERRPEAEFYYPGALEEHPALQRANPESGTLSDFVDPIPGYEADGAGATRE